MVTNDTVGAQKESVKKVVESSGDYMGEDKFLRRKGNVAENVSIIHKIALFFLERLKKKEEEGTLAALQKVNATKEPTGIINMDYL